MVIKGVAKVYGDDPERDFNAVCAVAAAATIVWLDTLLLYTLDDSPLTNNQEMNITFDEILLGLEFPKLVTYIN